jgi:hypothetical protein
MASPQGCHRQAVQSGVLGAFFATCRDACRVAVGQAGMNLSQSIMAFVLEVAARAVRGFLSR